MFKKFAAKRYKIADGSLITLITAQAARCAGCNFELYTPMFYFTNLTRGAKQLRGPVRYLLGSKAYWFKHFGLNN
jgi:hypothetical protein